MPEEKKQFEKVKIVGPLYLTKSILSIIRDVLLIVFLGVGIFGTFSIINAVENIGLPFGDMGEQQGDYGKEGSRQSGGDPLESSLQAIEKYYREGKKEDALREVNKLDILARSSGIPESERQILTILKKAIETNDDQLFYQTLEQIKEE